MRPTASDVDVRSAVEALRIAYCHRLDDGRLEEWLDLFTEDAVVNYASREGATEGRDALRSLAEDWLFAEDETRVHTVSNPLVDVADDRETATGLWYYRAVTIDEDGSALLEQGRYDERYRHDDVTWRIARLTTTVTYETHRSAGWAEPRPFE
ncbi:nuclear transport factor 2 family protein [Halomarina oriensis]|uniref:SnoaL-like domain-containing protein n=1 Tax=Halomarina oriensis TaxID=671145 RepID=A0A6B0GEQ8_9EURY|nr:nuclear transport factor 2 family protein [Halomarina oriensis]MWG33426.1 hypothetical protein [Halomarina oriensis]